MYNSHGFSFAIIIFGNFTYFENDRWLLKIKIKILSSVQKTLLIKTMNIARPHTKINLVVGWEEVYKHYLTGFMTKQGHMYLLEQLHV